MTQILSVWDNLDPRKRIVAVLAGVALVVAFLGLARMMNAPTYSLLYAGLDARTSGEIVTALEGQGVAYDVRGDAIYVDKSMRDQVRMSLASQGLPANGVAGYEILDALSGFGTTTQMFDAAYWRAKEGELARTILASPQVRSARVHIANVDRRPFDRAGTATASVIVTMNAGDLSSKQANAMRYLIASAVAGMSPDQVSVIDSMNGIVLAAGNEAENTGIDETGLRETALRSNIERLLAARVGPGKAIVEVNIDADMNSETITERVLDPEGRVTISSDVEEQSSSASGTGAGSVTVASNLPDGDGQAGEGSKSNDSLTRERVNYDVSEVRRERVKAPGEIKKITVAVLVDGQTTVADDGTVTWAERSPEELAAFETLVQSAIGFDAARGDVVTISSMQFSAPDGAGTLAEAGAFDFLSVNAMSLLQMAFLGGVALILGLFVLKPILTSAPAGATPEMLAAEADVMAAEAEAQGENAIELNPEVLPIASPEQARVEHLKDVISNRAGESTAILEEWLQEAEPQKESA